MEEKKKALPDACTMITPPGSSCWTPDLLPWDFRLVIFSASLWLPAGNIFDKQEQQVTCISYSGVRKLRTVEKICVEGGYCRLSMRLHV